MKIALCVCVCSNDSLILHNSRGNRVRTKERNAIYSMVRNNNNKNSMKEDEEKLVQGG